LLDAREKFAACARDVCPREIVSDCVRWLGDLEAATPTIVAATRDSRHRDVTDASVSIDGNSWVEVSPRAIPLDPGPHKLVFRRPDGPEVTVNVTLREGEKNREVAATFATGSDGEPSASASRPVPLGVWLIGGVGALGLASFATFGVLGVTERASDHCDTGCTPSQKDSVDAKYLIANVSLGVGVVGLGVATILYLTRPTDEPPPEPSSAMLIDVRPLPGGAFAALGSRF
jgi:hypothetical protein